MSKLGAELLFGEISAAYGRASLLLTTNLSTTGRGNIQGFTGSIQAAIEAHGQAKWGVDWQKVTLKPDAAKPDKLILTAPEPRCPQRQGPQ